MGESGETDCTVLPASLHRKEGERCVKHGQVALPSQSGLAVMAAAAAALQEEFVFQKESYSKQLSPRGGSVGWGDFVYVV